MNGTGAANEALGVALTPDGADVAVFSAWPPNSCRSASRGASADAHTDRMRPCSTRIAAGRIPSGVTTRLETNTCVILGYSCTPGESASAK